MKTIKSLIHLLKVGTARCAVPVLLALLAFCAPQAKAQTGYYVSPRVYSYSVTLTNGQAVTNVFYVTNLLNGVAYHTVGIWLTSPAITGGGGAGTGGVVTATIDFSPSYNTASYTNAAAGTNVNWTTTTLAGAAVCTLTDVVSNQVDVAWTNLPASLGDSVAWFRVTKLATTETNLAGGIYQLDFVLTP